MFGPGWSFGLPRRSARNCSIEQLLVVGLGLGLGLTLGLGLWLGFRVCTVSHSKIKPAARYNICILTNCTIRRSVNPQSAFYQWQPPRTVLSANPARVTNKTHAKRRYSCAQSAVLISSAIISSLSADEISWLHCRSRTKVLDRC